MFSPVPLPETPGFRYSQAIESRENIMKIPPKSQRKKLKKELKQQFGREVVHLGKYAGKEYAKVGVGIASELGFLFTGVRPTKPKRRR